MMSTAWRSKWMDWQPGDEIISVSPETELTELTKTNSVSFVSSIPGESQIISPPADGLDAWREPFSRWLNFACVRNARWFTNVNALLRSFAEWQAEHDDWAPDLAVFEALLIERDFLIGEVAGTRLVSGLGFRDDVGSITRFQREALP